MQGENGNGDELVMQLVESALSRPSQERAQFLAAACGTNSKLYAEVLDRVAWEERMGGFLQEAVLPRTALRRSSPIKSPGQWLPVAVLVCLCGAFAYLRPLPESPRNPVRLAILPVLVESGSAGPDQGWMADFAKSVRTLRPGVTVIPPEAAISAHAETPEAAWSTLQATHVLTVRVSRRGASAVILEGDTGQPVCEWRGDIPTMPAALTRLVAQIGQAPAARR